MAFSATRNPSARSPDRDLTAFVTTFSEQLMMCPDPEVRYRAALRQACAQVPFYRDACVDTGKFAAPALTPGTVTDRWFLLFPLHQPHRSGEGPPVGALPDPGLRDALETIGAFVEGDEIVEVRAAMTDFTHCGPARYRVLLADPSSASGSVAEALRSTLDRLRRGVHPAVVVGSAAQLANLVNEFDPLPQTIRWVERRELTDCTAPTGRAILHEPLLGCLGAWEPTCRSWHLLPRFRAFQRGSGVELADLERVRPTLLRYRPTQTDGLDAAYCSTHDTEIITLPAERWSRP